MGHLSRRHLDRDSFIRALHLHHSPRLHAAVLLASACLAGLLVSRFLLWVGLEAPYVRFPLSVLLAYGLFLLFVDWWLAYLGLKRNETELDGPNIEARDRSDAQGGGSFKGDGGEFDGGGASGSFDTPDGLAAKAEAGVRAKAAVSRVAIEGKAGAGAQGTEAFGVMEALPAVGEFFPLAILGIVLVGFAAAAGWIVAATPIVMVETAVEVAVSAGLIRSLARRRNTEWFASLFERTVWKATVLVLLAIAVGAAVRWIDPAADTVGQALARLLER